MPECVQITPVIRMAGGALAARRGVMEIAFQTRSLRDVCESDEKLKRQFGDRTAESIKTRLADLRAAASIQDVVSGNPRKITRDGKPLMILELDGGRVVAFCPNHLRMPLRPDGLVDWVAIYRIRILSIEDADA